MRLVTRAMLWRSVLAAVAVGGLLFLINRPSSSLLRPWSAAMWGQLAFSMLVPFVVSLASAIITRHELITKVGPVSPSAASDSASRR
jgi:hypothetical protein